MKEKVLVLGVASVQYDAVLVLKDMGYEVHACAMKKDGPAAEVADYFTEINILNEPELKKYIIDNKIDVVYSVGSDLAIPVASKISEELSMPHFVSYDTAYNCNHKNCMRNVLNGEIGSVPFQVMDELTELEIDYPVILKPTDSQGQRGIFLVRNYNELQQSFQTALNFSREGKVIVEKYIDGPEVSVNGYMYNGELKFLVVSDRVTWPQYTGLIHKHIIPSREIENDNVELNAVVENACLKLGIHDGPVYFQMKIENGHPYIIEVTPRLDGCHMWKLIKHSTGFDLMKLTWQHLIEGNVEELCNKNDVLQPMSLEFFCQKPGEVFVKSDNSVPEYAIDYYFYYNDGDIVRPVNGKFDKVGYFIEKLIVR